MRLRWMRYGRSGDGINRPLGLLFRPFYRIELFPDFWEPGTVEHGQLLWRDSEGLLLRPTLQELLR